MDGPRKYTEINPMPLHELVVMSQNILANGKYKNWKEWKKQE
jgi:hypothetical protein